MGVSRKRRKLTDHNAEFRARAEQYRAQAKVLRKEAEAAPIVERRHELLETAEGYESLAESIEGLRFRDD